MRSVRHSPIRVLLPSSADGIWDRSFPALLKEKAE